MAFSVRAAFHISDCPLGDAIALILNADRLIDLVLNTLHVQRLAENHDGIILSIQTSHQSRKIPALQLTINL